MDFAIKVTRHQHELSERDCEALRAHGYSDEQILTAVHVIGFFNYYTRMVDALGVEPEDFMVEGG